MRKFKMKEEDKLRPFTEKEFEKLVKIELKYYEEMRLSENNSFDESLKVLDKQQQEIVKYIDTEIYNQLLKRVDDWRKDKIYEYGYCRMKNIFMIGYYRALIPILFKFYVRNEYENQFLLDPLKMNYFIKTKYPHLNNTLRNMHKLHIKFRKEVETEGMTHLMGFNYDVSEVQHRGFSHSIIIELVRKIRGFKTTSIRKAKARKILKAIKEHPKLNQGEIAKMVGCSQQLVSKVKNEYGGKLK